MKTKQALEYIKNNPVTGELTYKYRKIKEHPVTGNYKPSDQLLFEVFYYDKD